MGTITRTFTNNIGASGVLGTSAFNNASLNNVTLIPPVTMNLLSTATLSGDATISFTSNIDSTYDEYWFVFKNIHPETNDRHLQFQASTNGGSSYGVTCQNVNYRAGHKEDGSFTFRGYVDNDVANSTSFFIINEGMGNASDASCSGILKLYNPSSTTFVKHYVSQFSGMNFQSPPQATNYFTAGYFNTTSAIDAVQFKASGGNLDAGTIKLYGVS